MEEKKLSDVDQQEVRAAYVAMAKAERLHKAAANRFEYLCNKHHADLADQPGLAWDFFGDGTPKAPGDCAKPR